MARRSFWLFIAAWAAIVAMPRADTSLSVGLVPFDVAATEGNAANASEALAKVIRLEMLKTKGLQPQLLALPPGTQLPLAPKKAAELGRAAKADVVLVGTILDASSSHSNHGASIPQLGGYVGGGVSRTSAELSVHVEIVNSTSGEIFDTFEVRGKASGTGVGADITTMAGSFRVGDAGWEKTPMGKALRDVAQKIVAETSKRAGKLGRRSAAPGMED
jgi:curli biogenesis system outer membrane secretion channel CsgG